MRTMIAVTIGLAAGAVCVAYATHARAHARDLPPGPLANRHALMEDIGSQAKVIGDAMKSGDYAPVGAAAKQIRTAATNVLSLFPKDSTHPNSRAKPEIWTQWEQFEAINKNFERTAGALVTAAEQGSGIPAAAQAMFDTCKTCHDQFRIPEKRGQ